MTIQEKITTEGAAPCTIKCTYTEIYLTDKSKKLISLQRRNFGNEPIINATEVLPDGWVKGTLTKKAYEYICNVLESRKKIKPGTAYGRVVDDFYDNYVKDMVRPRRYIPVTVMAREDAAMVREPNKVASWLALAVGAYLLLK